MAEELQLVPSEVNVTYYQNDGRTITVTWPVGVDLTSPARTFLCQIKAAKADTAALGTLTAAASGTRSIILTPDADAATLDLGVYCWDLQYTIGAARPVTVCTGLWNVVEDVSR